MYRSKSFWAWLIATNLVTAAATFLRTHDEAWPAGYDSGVRLMTREAESTAASCTAATPGDECGKRILKEMRRMYCYTKHNGSLECNR